ncbi:serine hydrolase [Streptomyces sp. NPDC087917]|uniref:serine hydrolase n=1 Tax=Streptomyces sp. NPDC087917 TaxID=3155060 RepID=UPI0034288AF8
MQFEIASQTKTFTANLALQLVGEEMVALEDHVSTWVPGAQRGSDHDPPTPQPHQRPRRRLRLAHCARRARRSCCRRS